VSEDDRLDWAASGSLAVGASYTFTPRYPDCANSRAIVVTVSWDTGATIVISATVPGDTRLQSRISPGVVVSGTALRAGTARLCLFPYIGVTNWQSTSVTITNTGTVAADLISVSGHDANDWEIFYYDACQAVDADRDGWSDSVEHSMENLTMNEDGLALMGTDYLRGSGTALPDDEFDFVPPDFDDDGLVTASDLMRVGAHLGEGTGVTASAITPNAGADNFHLQKGGWRRFDLDGDGWITIADVEIERSLLGTVGTPTAVEPTIAITGPIGPVMRGSWSNVTTFASAPRGVTRVDFFIDRKFVLSDSEAPFTAWWQVPKRAGATYTIEVIGYDGSGRSSSASRVIASQ
jgi:hypothetical protein